ncbi:uncharacterized protein LOC110823063 [Carica papaya]|uniref:uncharacterized protein LOC110823063 n=1 Tax=Carica papaya TaxID=3649 RepID=UPI000B8C8B94|nr:uncharacterized protein LOC110823063 [Carica papaya]
MVSRVETMKKKQQGGDQENNNYSNHKGGEGGYHQQQLQKQMQCNKAKVCKFKRSSSNLEEDGASSAILFLACIACTPSF